MAGRRAAGVLLGSLSPPAARHAGRQLAPPLSPQSVCLAALAASVTEVGYWVVRLWLCVSGDPARPLFKCGAEGKGLRSRFPEALLCGRQRGSLSIFGAG